MKIIESLPSWSQGKPKTFSISGYLENVCEPYSYESGIEAQISVAEEKTDNSIKFLGQLLERMIEKKSLTAKIFALS